MILFCLFYSPIKAASHSQKACIFPILEIFSQPEDFIGIYSRIQKALSGCIPKKAIKSLCWVTLNRGTVFIWPKKIFTSFCLSGLMHKTTRETYLYSLDSYFELKPWIFVFDLALTLHSPGCVTSAD